MAGSKESVLWCLVRANFAVVDPGFPVARGANPPGGGRQHTHLPGFSKKQNEIKNILVLDRHCRVLPAHVGHWWIRGGG